MAQEEITPDQIGLPVDPAVDREKLRLAIASASDRPGTPTKWNLGDPRSQKQILQDEQAAKGTEAQPAPETPQITMASVAKDPNFRALPDAERRKVIETVLAQDSGFQGLPKEEQAKVRATLLPAPGFWESLTEGGPRAMVGESLPGMLADRMKDVHEAMPRLQAEDDAERKRRVAAGESLNGMEQWRLNRLNEIIKEGKPDRPPMSAGEIWEGVKKAAIDNPAGFGGKLARGIVTAPEIFFLPQSLPVRAGELAARAGRIAETVARTGADVAQVSAVVGAESTLRQLNEFGEAGPAQTTMDMAMTAAPIVGARALFPRTKAQVTMAADLALAKEAKAKGFEPSSELTVNVVQDTEARVSQGQPVDAALKDALEAVKVSPEAAAEAAALIKEGEVHAPEAREVPQGGEQQHIGTGTQRAEAEAGGGNRPVGGAEVPKEEGKIVQLHPEVSSASTELLQKIRMQDRAEVRLGLKDLQAKLARGEIDEAEVLRRMNEAAKDNSDGIHALAVIAGEHPTVQSSIEAEAKMLGNVRESAKIRDRIMAEMGVTVDDIGFMSWMDAKHLPNEAAIRAYLEKALASKAKVIRPQQFQPLPEGVPNRFVSPDEARAIYEMAGVDAEAASKMADKPIAIGALRQRLTKFMGGQRYADGVLVDAVHDGKFGPQSGKIDPRLLKVLGASAAIGLGVGAYTEDPKKAIVAALATGGVIAAGSLLMRGARATSKAMRDDSYRIGNTTDKFQGDVKWGEFQNQKFKESLKALVSDKKQREQITMFMQGDESIKLTPAQEQVVKAVREFFTVNGEKGLKAGAIEGLIDDYVTQLWTGLNKNDSLWRNLVASLGRGNTATGGMSPRSRFGLERVIPSYKEGMAKGLIPSTLDIADIVEIYGNSINRAIANKNFVAALKNDRMPNGTMILGTRDQIVKNLSGILEKTREQWGGKDALVDDIRRFAESKIHRDYELMTHRQLPGMLVHKDVAPVLKWFFDASNPNAATKLAYAVSVAAKRGIFSFSFFHNASLGQAMLGAPLSAWGKLVNGDAWRMLKGRQGVNPMEELIRGGLNVTERPLEGDVTPFSTMLKFLNEKYPIVGAPAKGVHIVQKAMDAFLWSVVQPTLKTATAMASFEKTLKKYPNLSRADAAKAAASFTNDLFGGLDWFRIADGAHTKLGRDLALAVTSPSGRRFMQILALAPDWTVATARTLVKAIPGISRREIAALHQGYVVKQALLYGLIGTGLNQYFSGHNFWENEDPTMIDLGDGRKLQLSKHFMEPIHWLMSPSQQALNKLGYVVKEPVELALNQQWLSPKGAPPIVPKNATALGAGAARTKHALGGVMPITGQVASDQGVSPALSGFFGFPIYGKTEEQAIEAARARADAEGKNADKAAKRVQKQRETKRRKAEESRAQ